ncbi:MAG: NAD(P)H-hydrate epimerase [Candidatus Zapsychrus exili]|nr:NAD(P)H-hydrate epimerase [Candidatus Zapsychrus exili]
MKRKVASVKQIQNLDKRAIKDFGVASIVLMENAGRAAAHEIASILKNKRSPKVAIVCGFGNNAGDGFVIARHLINRKVDVGIFLVGSAKALKQDALVNYKILKKCKYNIVECVSKEVLEKVVTKFDLIVDAIFGVGLSREVKDPFKGIIEILNKTNKKIVSVDVPSGLDGTTGNIYGCCIKASKTVTFSFAKQGFYKNCGPKYVGKTVVVDIGIPKELMDEV